MHLSADKVIDPWEQQAMKQIAQMQAREAQELSRLDKLIAAAREFAHEVKDRTVAFAKEIQERAGSLFSNPPQEEHAKAAPEQAQVQEQERPPTPEMLARLDELLTGFRRRMKRSSPSQPGWPTAAIAWISGFAGADIEATAGTDEAKEPKEKQEHSRGFGFGIET